MWKQTAANEGSSEERVQELRQRIDTLNVAFRTIQLLHDRLMMLLRFSSWDAGKRRVGAFTVMSAVPIIKFANL